MVKTSHLRVGAACVLAFVACARIAHAQAAGPAAAANRDFNLRAYAELLRSDLRAQKVAIITEVMQFTEAEDAAFWPVYREYEADLAKINDDRIALITEYSLSYEALTDATADRLAQSALALEAQAACAHGELLRSLQSPCSRRRRRRGSSRSSIRSCCSWICRSPRHCPSHRGNSHAHAPPRRFPATAAVVAIGNASLSADRVRLRSGQAVTGSFMSADVKIVRLLLDNGQIAEFPVDNISAVEFSPRKAPPAPAPDPAKTPPSITVPMGTVLSVRLTQAIEVDAAQAGMTFKSVLDDPVMIGGQVVLPRGSAVVLQAAKVEQAGNFKGSDKITLKANSIAFGGRQYEIATAQVESKGSGEGKKTTRKVARRRGSRRRRRRDCRRRHRRGHRRGRRRRDRRDRRQPGHRASEARRRDAPAVHAERGGHGAPVKRCGGSQSSRAPPQSRISPAPGTHTMGEECPGHA